MNLTTKTEGNKTVTSKKRYEFPEFYLININDNDIICTSFGNDEDLNGGGFLPINGNEWD